MIFGGIPDGEPINENNTERHGKDYVFLISSIMCSIQIVGIFSTFVSFFEICPRNSIHNHLYTSFESLQFEFISLICKRSH